MKTYYVATISQYVLVDANGIEDARSKGTVALQELSDERNRLKPRICTIRIASDDEIASMMWHKATVSREERRAAYCVADALRDVAIAMEEVEAGRRSKFVSAEDIIQILLDVADRIDPQFDRSPIPSGTTQEQPQSHQTTVE